MRRLAIMSVYDNEGILDQYVFEFIKALREVADERIVVVNGKIRHTDLHSLESIVEKVIVRSNVGFDAGAYKTAMIECVGKEALREYDELILCNDTCYGPFISFGEIWKKMENKICDFWGFTLIKNGLSDHIQSYFCVYKKHILKSNILYDYMQNNVDCECKDVREVIQIFEKGLYKVLEEEGYSPAVYCEDVNLNIYTLTYELIQRCQFPFMKKKCFDNEFNPEGRGIPQSLSWIQKETNYDVNMILESATRLYGDYLHGSVVTDEEIQQVKSCVKQFAITKKTLQDFIQRESDIYIYGCGIYAKDIFHLYMKESSKLRGFVVSDEHAGEIKQLYGFPVYGYSQIPKDASIIIAMSENNTRQVMECVKHERVIRLF